MNMRELQSGSALIYILIAIALLALLTSTLIEPASQQSQTQNATNLVSEMQGQVSLIASALDECILTYPDQDSELTTTQQKNAPYPINPKDPYFTSQSAVPAVATVQDVSGIRCPGNPGGTGATNQNHALIFGGTSNKFMPPPPNQFTAWQYYNGADGVFIFTRTDKTDAYITSALAKLDAKYSACQADVIDASSSAVTISSDTVPGDSAAKTCASGGKCFRYWIVQKATMTPAVAGCP